MPHNRSKPFIIAFYHGCTSKPDLDAFLSDLLKELRRLDPSYKLGPNEKRSMTIRIRAIIGDAPARSWLKCVKGHSGYYPCERCHIRGEILRLLRQNIPDETGKRSGMKFSTLDDPKRTDEKWDTYLTELEPNQPLGGIMTHRIGITPFDKVANLVKPISSFPLEEMHLVDGGAIKDAIKILLKLPDSWVAKLKQDRPKKNFTVNRLTNRRTYTQRIRSQPAAARRRRPPAR